MWRMLQNMCDSVDNWCTIFAFEIHQISQIFESSAEWNADNAACTHVRNYLWNGNSPEKWQSKYIVTTGSHTRTRTHNKVWIFTSYHKHFSGCARKKQTVIEMFLFHKIPSLPMCDWKMGHAHCANSHGIQWIK